MPRRDAVLDLEHDLAATGPRGGDGEGQRLRSRSTIRATPGRPGRRGGRCWPRSLDGDRSIRPHPLPAERSVERIGSGAGRCAGRRYAAGSRNPLDRDLAADTGCRGSGRRSVTLPLGSIAVVTMAIEAPRSGRASRRSGPAWPSHLPPLRCVQPIHRTACPASQSHPTRSVTTACRKRLIGPWPPAATRRRLERPDRIPRSSGITPRRCDDVDDAGREQGGRPCRSRHRRLHGARQGASAGLPLDPGPTRDAGGDLHRQGRDRGRPVPRARVDPGPGPADRRRRVGRQRHARPRRIPHADPVPHLERSRRSIRSTPRSSRPRPSGSGSP